MSAPNRGLAELRDAYFRGHYEETLSRISAAADAGQREAQWLLGDAYQYGHGVEPNLVLAMQWYLAAEAQGSGDAALALAMLFDPETEFADAERDSDRPRDQERSRHYYDSAARLFRDAAEQGDGDALFKLGQCYQCGWGVPADDDEALACYRRAFQAGNAVAANELFLLHASRHSPYFDPDQARYYYRAAKNAGCQTVHDPDYEDESPDS